MPSETHKIIDLYRRHAGAWTRQRGKQLVERKWLDKFLELQPDTPSVLDIGCGSGEPIGRYLLECGCSLTGADASPELLEIARDSLPSATWISSDMRGLDLGTRFHGLLAWNSTFHLTPDDQRRMFPIFRQHAAPGTALMFTSGPARGEAMGEFEGEALYHSSLDPSEYQELMEQHGFELVDHAIEDPMCNQQTVWLAQLRDVG